jgi:predicted nucleic acid-binding protein
VIVLLDSNIIIYSAIPEHVALRGFVRGHAIRFSAVSLVEVLGFAGLTEADRQSFEAMFATGVVLPIDQPVVDRAVTLRQRRRMQLGDAFIAATALVHGLTLVTRNSKDFAWIDGLTVIDPLAPG